jgi:hypothetical protein
MSEEHVVKRCCYVPLFCKNAVATAGVEEKYRKCDPPQPAPVNPKEELARRDEATTRQPEKADTPAVPPGRLDRIEVGAITRLEPQQQKSPLNQSFGSARSVPQLDETDGHQSFLRPSGIKVRRLTGDRIVAKLYTLVPVPVCKCANLSNLACTVEWNVNCTGTILQFPGRYRSYKLNRFSVTNWCFLTLILTAWEFKKPF